MGEGEKKRCSRCGVSKPRSEFGPAKANRDGLLGRCRDCIRVVDAEKRKAQGKQPRARYEDPPGLKTCRRCREQKPITEFTPAKATRDGHMTRCRTCVRAVRAEKARAEGRAGRRIYDDPDGFKTCRRCERTKPVTEFGRYKRSADGLLARCRECVREESRARTIARGGRPRKAYGDPPGYKTCRRCEVRKPTDQFRPEPRNTTDGLRSYCIDCSRVVEWLRKGVTEQEIPPLRQTPPSGMKRCSRCDDTKPLEDFYPNRARVDGRDTYCRECAQQDKWERALRKAERESRPPPRRLVKDMAPDGFRTCTVCGEVKPLDGFYSDRRAPKGTTSACRDCKKVKAAERRLRLGIRPIPRFDDPPGTKTCRRCLVRKDVALFAAAPRNTTDGLQSWCVDCANENTKAWQRANPATMAILQATRRGAVESGNVPERDWNRLVNRLGGACAYCGAAGVKLTVDHVVPIMRGGRHTIGNLMPICQSCNSSKNVSLLADWRYRPRQRDRLVINSHPGPRRLP